MFKVSEILLQPLRVVFLQHEAETMCYVPQRIARKHMGLSEDTKENCVGQKDQTSTAWTALPRDVVSECSSSQVTAWFHL